MERFVDRVLDPDSTESYRQGTFERGPAVVKFCEDGTRYILAEESLGGSYTLCMALGKDGISPGYEKRDIERGSGVRSTLGARLEEAHSSLKEYSEC